MDKELIQEFINKIILEKKKDLLSIEMDLDFHLTQKRKIGNENKLRNQLKKEKNKIGNKRNLEILSTLDDKINQLNIVNKKINELISIKPQIIEYIEYLEKNKNKIIKLGLDL